MMKSALAGILSLISCLLFAQEDRSVPSIKGLRAEESYQFLDSASEKKVFLQSLKRIKIGQKKPAILTLGGGYRARLEHFTNENYTAEDATYYTQRMDFHASVSIRPHLRFFGELYSGYVSTPEKQLFQSDELALHQGFIEWIPVNSPDLKTTIRLGRQEIGFGASRLVGIREGPNIRRSFDLVKVATTKGTSTLNIIYGQEVAINFFAFDNESNLFEEEANTPTLWGAYLTESILLNWKLDLYYFGFHSRRSAFNDVAGEETRHTIGARSYGSIGRFRFNTEFAYQLGDIDNNSISAFNLETDWKYLLVKKGWKPLLGIKLDWSSGDKQAGDGKVQTFNPLFVNPAIYSLAAVNTPANITSLHPSLTVYPSEGFSIYIDYALFFRTQSNDGLYTPPRFLIRPPGELETKHIGDVMGFSLGYEFNRNIKFDLLSSYFIAGRFLKETGPSAHTFYFSPTIYFKF